MNQNNNHKFENTISDENTLESNVNSRPVAKFCNDPKYVKEFKQSIHEFPQNYAIISMIGSDEVYHDFNVFCADKFVKNYLINKYETATRVIANKYNQIFLSNMERKIQDIENSVINKFNEDITETDVEKIKNELLKKIIDVKEYLMTIFNSVKLNDNISEEHVKELMNNECNISYDDFETQYQEFKDKNLPKLEEDFRKIEDYSGPLISAFKIRGVHEDVEHAKDHAVKLHELEPYVDTYVANVGEWAAWTACREKVNDVVYMDKSLSKLMKRYTDNVNKSNVEFDARRKASLEQSKMSRKEEIKKKVNKNN